MKVFDDKPLRTAMYLVVLLASMFVTLWGLIKLG